MFCFYISVQANPLHQKFNTEEESLYRSSMTNSHNNLFRPDTLLAPELMPASFSSLLSPSSLKEGGYMHSFMSELPPDYTDPGVKLLLDHASISGLRELHIVDAMNLLNDVPLISDMKGMVENKGFGEQDNNYMEEVMDGVNMQSQFVGYNPLNATE